MLKCLAAGIFLFLLAACNQPAEKDMNRERFIQLVVLDPGHFHAALVQKQMYDGVDTTVYVYAPDGPEVEDYIKRTNAFNSREENPTSWKLEVYKGKDFLEKMLKDKPGNLVVLAGNNQRKTEYIEACVKAGLHVYSDKPMAIDPGDYDLLTATMKNADENGILVYDIMTERFEITNRLQKLMSGQKQIFGELLPGSLEEPALEKKSVHHFYKEVSGIPLIRPDWFFDVKQEGTALADVGTHLVDLILLGAGSRQNPVKIDEVEIIKLETRTIALAPEEFQLVTGKDSYPAFLQTYVDEDSLMVPSNSYLDFKVRKHYAHVSVEWAFKAEEGGGDTHYSIMRGSISDLIIRQGPEERFMPVVYIKLKKPEYKSIFETNLQLFLKESLNEIYPGSTFESLTDSSWRLNIPNKYRIGHEAHFEEVTKTFLSYLQLGRIPDWEQTLIQTKYSITTSARYVSK